MLKKYIFIFLLFPAPGFAQDAGTVYDNCVSILTKQLTIDRDRLVKKWFEGLTGGVTLACEDHVPLGRCKIHKKQCARMCDCYEKYTLEGAALTRNFDVKAEACRAEYNAAIARANENARIEAEKQEKREREEAAAKEKAEQERQKAERLAKEKEGLKSDQPAREKEQQSKGSGRDKKAEDEYRQSKAYVDAQHAGYVMNRRASSEKQAQKEMDDHVAYMTSIFSNPDFINGSSFVNSNYGLNFTMSVLASNNIPMYENSELYQRKNSTYDNQSSPGKATSLYGPLMQAELHLLNNKFVDVKGIGSYMHGWSKIGGLIDRDDFIDELCYGAELGLGLGQVKLFGSYVTGNRKLSTSSSSYMDIADVDMNTWGTVSYAFDKMSAGITYQFDRTDSKIDPPRERYVKLSFLKERPDYDYNKTDQIWGLGLKARGWLDVGVEYFPKYPVAGSPAYRITNNKNQSMWSVYFAKTMTMFNGKY